MIKLIKHDKTNITKGAKWCEGHPKAMQRDPKRNPILLPSEELGTSNCQLRRHSHKETKEKACPKACPKAP